MSNKLMIEQFYIVNISNYKVTAKLLFRYLSGYLDCCKGTKRE